MSRNKIEINEEDLREMHDDYNMSQQAIAEHFCCSDTTVGRRMRKFDIKARSTSKAQLVYRAKNRNLINLSIIIDYLDGLMLSDGNLPNEKHTTGYNQYCKHKDWLDCTQVVFEAADIESTVKPYERFDPRWNKTCIGYIFYTKYYPEFIEQRKRWYLDGKKIVPEDIRLTEECVANWYMGDGCLGKNGTVRFSTDSFTHEEVTFLSDYLNAMLDIETTAQNYAGNYRIYIPKRYTSALFEYIEPYILECYAYKLGGT